MKVCFKADYRGKMLSQLRLGAKAIGALKDIPSLSRFPKVQRASFRVARIKSKKMPTYVDMWWISRYKYEN